MNDPIMFRLDKEEREQEERELANEELEVVVVDTRPQSPFTLYKPNYGFQPDIIDLTTTPTPMDSPTGSPTIASVASPVFLMPDAAPMTIEELEEGEINEKEEQKQQQQQEQHGVDVIRSYKSMYKTIQGISPIQEPFPLLRSLTYFYRLVFEHTNRLATLRCGKVYLKQVVGYLKRDLALLRNPVFGKCKSTLLMKEVNTFLKLVLDKLVRVTKAQEDGQEQEVVSLRQSTRLKKRCRTIYHGMCT